MAQRILIVTLACLVVGQSQIMVQRAAGQQRPPGGPGLSQQDLENLVAPVALYPDALLDQVLDASQHPSALVSAGDSVHRSGSDKQTGVESSWPASVQALLKYPDVLAKLDNELSWTTRLGNAVKTQSADVDKAIQVVRQKAQAAGNLATNQYETVDVSNDEITIVPIGTDIMYVPEYDPSVIYSPHTAAAPLIAFGVGVALGAAIAHNDHYDYYHHHYYDHIGHFGAYGHVGASHFGGPLLHGGHIGHTGLFGHTGASHIGGPIAGVTHIGHTGPFGHGGITVGHIGRHSFGGIHRGFHGGGFRGGAHFHGRR